LRYRLGTFVEIFGSEDAVVAIVARAFDAREILDPSEDAGVDGVAG
jgi:hypothetical protein